MDKRTIQDLSDSVTGTHGEMDYFLHKLSQAMVSLANTSIILDVEKTQVAQGAKNWTLKSTLYHTALDGKEIKRRWVQKWEHQWSLVTTMLTNEKCGKAGTKYLYIHKKSVQNIAK